MELLKELDIEVTQISPQIDLGQDVAQHLIMTQEKLHSRILLEIEQSNTPCGASTKMPSLKLERQFDTPDT